MNTHYKDLPKDEKLEICIEENVLIQIENLRTHPSVLAALASGKLRLHTWVYEIESGVLSDTHHLFDTRFESDKATNPEDQSPQGIRASLRLRCRGSWASAEACMREILIATKPSSPWT